mmetsp:Transcript_8702/g.18756  ORF Transcript_8702/g.18756 Transcript_8702/m.18756 type:complete len:330 (+) Transcript_8702:183-1172(+)
MRRREWHAQKKGTARFRSILLHKANLAFASFGGILLFRESSDVHALSIRHRGIAPRWQAARIQIRNGQSGRFETVLASAFPSDIFKVADSGEQCQRRISVTVEATAAISTKSNERDVASSSTSKTSISHQLVPRTQAKTTSITSSTTSNSDGNDEIPMDTPARQSCPAHLCLRAIPGKGFGVICREPISEGDVVGEYLGEVMTEDVKDRRYMSSEQQTEEDKEWIQSRLDRGQTMTGCYLYGISIPQNTTKNKRHSGHSRVYVDAEDEYKSIWTRFINHASPPLDNVTPRSGYDGYPRVWFVANRNIEEGEEICFDYGDDYWLEDDDVF